MGEATGDGPGDPSLVNHDWSLSKAQINGTMAHITGIFGFTIAGLVLTTFTVAELKTLRNNHKTDY